MAKAKAKTKPAVRNVTKEEPNVRPFLGQVAEKLGRCRALKPSVILVRASGSGGGDYAFTASEKGVQLVKPTPDMKPAIEIMGDARRIVGVLTGQKDARTQFLAGGFRVRGDLRYFSDLAVELGILKEPL